MVKKIYTNNEIDLGCPTFTLRKKIAHSTVYHNLSHLYVDIQSGGLIKFRENSGVQMSLTHVIFRYLEWMSPETSVLTLIGTP